MQLGRAPSPSRQALVSFLTEVAAALALAQLSALRFVAARGLGHRRRLLGAGVGPVSPPYTVRTDNTPKVLFSVTLGDEAEVEVGLV